MDEEELKRYLEDVTYYLKRYRAMMLPEARGYSDAPVMLSFGSKSPCNDQAIDNADAEARALGELAQYCMKQGTLPRRSLEGFWCIRGKIRGLTVTLDWDEFSLMGDQLDMDVLQPIKDLCEHMIIWRSAILNTPDVDPYLERCRKMRRVAQSYFPHESQTWLSAKQMVDACSKEGYKISEATLGRWAKTKPKWVLNDKHGSTLFLFEHVINRCAEARKANLQNIAKATLYNSKHKAS